MSRCTDPDISTYSECTGSFNATGLTCCLQPTYDLEQACLANPLGMPFPRLWMPFPTEDGVPGESFDDLPRALLSVFDLLTGVSLAYDSRVWMCSAFISCAPTGENWPTIMMTAVDGSGGTGDKDTRVSLDANPAAALFFVLAQLVLNAFILELFAGSIIDTYDRLRDDTRGSILLTDSQVSLPAHTAPCDARRYCPLRCASILPVPPAERVGTICPQHHPSASVLELSPHSSRARG